MSKRNRNQRRQDRQPEAGSEGADAKAEEVGPSDVSAGDTIEVGKTVEVAREGSMRVASEHGITVHEEAFVAPGSGGTDEERHPEPTRTGEGESAVPADEDEQALKILGEPEALAPTKAVARQILVREKYRDLDDIIVRDVYAEDCYRLRDLPYPIRRILDVGAHIGVSTLKLADTYQEAEIAAVEPHPGNLEALVINTVGMNAGRPGGHGSRVEIVNGAISYESGPMILHGTIYEGCINTGGSFVGRANEHLEKSNADEYRTHHPVRVMTIERVMELMGWDRIDLVKLDCEGSEMSILEHGPIEKCGIIVGEWHDEAGFMRLAARRFGIKDPMRQQPGAKWRMDILRGGPCGLFRFNQPGWRWS